MLKNQIKDTMADSHRTILQWINMPSLENEATILVDRDTRLGYLVLTVAWFLVILMVFKPPRQSLRK